MTLKLKSNLKYHEKNHSILLCMLIALWACEKDTPTPPASY